MNQQQQQIAYTLVNQAIHSGKLTRPSVCQICGWDIEKLPKGRIEGHHWKGYDYPLEVWWVCSSCNKSRLPHDGSLTIDQAKIELFDHIQARKWLFETMIGLGSNSPLLFKYLRDVVPGPTTSRPWDQPWYETEKPTTDVIKRGRPRHVNNIFGQWIDGQGWTRGEAATILGITRPHIDRLSRNERRPGIDLAYKIEQLTDGEVSVGYWTQVHPHSKD